LIGGGVEHSDIEAGEDEEDELAGEFCDGTTEVNVEDAAADRLEVGVDPKDGAVAGDGGEKPRAEAKLPGEQGDDTGNDLEGTEEDDGRHYVEKHQNQPFEFNKGLCFHYTLCY